MIWTLRNLPDGELLARSATDPNAFAVFYRRHEGLVLRFLMSRCRDPELAADLTAEAFAAAFEAADTFDTDLAGGSSALPWLFTIARNLLRMSVRRGVVADDARRRLGCERIPLEDSELKRVEELSGDGIDGLLAVLSPELREAIVARVLDERDYEEIAGDLGSSQMVVRKRVSRGLSRLRDVLGADGTRKGL